MNRTTKTALAAVAAMALAASVQAAYSPGDLLLGFTDNNPSHSDLMLDLGPLSLLPSGALNSSASAGQVGLTSGGLLTELNSLYGGIGSANFAVVGSSFQNATVNRAFGTVPHGNATLGFGAAGFIDSPVTALGLQIGDGSGPTANSQAYAASLGYGYSLTENITASSSPWVLNTANFSTAAASSSVAVVEDLYQRINGVESLAGTFNLDPSGVLSFSAVPEPSTYVLAGLGLLALGLRRRLAHKSA